MSKKSRQEQVLYDRLRQAAFTQCKRPGVQFARNRAHKDPIDSESNFVEDKEHVNNIVDQYRDCFPVVYGINRSGSTLLRNIVNTIFDGNIEVQRSAFFETDRKIIGIYRDFRDSAISRWRVNLDGQTNTFTTEKDATIASWEAVKSHAHEIRRQARDDLRRLRDHYDSSQLLLIKYELFHENFDYLHDQLEPFLNITIGPQLREFIGQTWSKSRVRTVYTEVLGTFLRADASTHFHGGHIYKGSHGTWKELLQRSDHDTMTEYMREELEEWGYEL